MIRHLLLALSLGMLVACATATGASDPSSVPTDSVEICTAQCEAIGLEFDALTIAKRHVGCVCEPE